MSSITKMVLFILAGIILMFLSYKYGGIPIDTIMN